MKPILLIFFTTALAAYAQPSWNPIMSTGGDTGESSAIYYQFNNANGTYAYPVTMTSLSYQNPVKLATNGTTIEQLGQYLTGSCSNYGPAGELFQSYLGPWNYPTSTYKGLNALVTFGYNSSDITGFSGVGANLEQTIFFGEQQCYAGGREYGITLDGLTGSISFYVLTNANLGGGYVAHDVAGTGYTGSQYYFAMWPVDDGGGTCHFETRILYPSTSTVRSSTISAASIASAGISSFDLGFCAGVLNDQGYVTATTKVSPTLTFGTGAATSFNMNIGGIWIGK